jgi:hypothetical protein
MAQLGGNVLRGYLQGRYRDKALTAVQAEFRTPVWRRLGAAVFGGVGQVGPRLADFDGGELKSAGRFGLRYAPSKQDKLNLRFDLDVWQNSCAYVTLGEAFERRGASRERPRVTCATSLAPPRMHERPRD